MDMLRVVLILFKFGFAYADNYGILFRLYQGSTSLHASRLPLVRCAIENLGLNAFGIAFNPVNGDCALLNREWLTDKPTDEGLIYMERIGNSQVFVPSKFLQNNSTTGEIDRFYQRPVVEIQNGSSVDFYFVSSSAATGFQILFRKDADYLLRAHVRYYDSLLSCRAKYNEKWSSYKVDLSLQWTVNKMEKLSFRAAGASFEIYHDDQWITTFNDGTSPHFSFDFKLITIWLSRDLFQLTSHCLYSIDKKHLFI